MSEVYIVSAKTVDEAIDLASKLYGGKNKEISHDIISLPKKGFLGIGSKDAVIKVTVTDETEDDLASLVKEIKSYKTSTAAESGYYTPAEEKAPAPAESKKKAEKPQKSEAPKAEKAEKHQKPVESKPQREKEEKPAKAEPSEKPQKSQKKSSQKKAQKPHEDKAAKQERIEKRSEEAEKKIAVSREEMDMAIEFINAMIANMNLSANAVALDAPEGVEFVVSEKADVYPAINIEGNDTGILIGHHGETLDAIQYLVNLYIFRKGGADRGGRENIKITVDIENYRAKREDTLRSLARRMAARAVKNKRNVFLEPMNPYERRIIHSELQSYPDVSTHSVGSDTNRKIVITYEGADKQSGNRRRGRGNRRGHGNGGQTEVSTPKGLPLPSLED